MSLALLMNIPIVPINTINITLVLSDVATASHLPTKGTYM